jgi:hypothetical protein
MRPGLIKPNHSPRVPPTPRAYRLKAAHYPREYGETANQAGGSRRRRTWRFSAPASQHSGGRFSGTFDLSWTRNWTVFPTNDIDMIILNPPARVMSTAGVP